MVTFYFQSVVDAVFESHLSYLLGFTSWHRKVTILMFLPEDLSTIRTSVTFKFNEGKCNLRKSKMFQDALHHIIPGMDEYARLKRVNFVDQ